MMPNWCCGDFKIRGHIDDVEKFLNHSISKGSITRIEDNELALNDIQGYLKNTYRCFIEDEYSETFYVNKSGLIIVIIPTEHAWGPRLKEFKELSKRFNVDFRFYGYERGMQFNCEFEIIKGEITISKKIKFNDYEWECPNPMVGG